MAASVTRGQRIGNVVKWEVDGGSKGYCRKNFATVTVEADMGVGALLNSSGDWIDGSGSNGGDAAMIVIDETIYDKNETGDHELVVLFQGPAIVSKNGLTFDGTAIAADYTAATAALLALGIVVEDSVA
jgi:hypothetical protein